MNVRSACIALAVVALAGRSARAEIDLRALGKLAGASWTPATARPALIGKENLPVLVELPPGEDPAPSGLPRLATRFTATGGALPDLLSLSSAHPNWQVTWSPPLRPLADRAVEWARVPAFRTETGRTGRGVYVGIVDTGADLLHPDLRNADGTTRVLWLVDFATPPLGLHPEAEQRCPEKLPCRVISASDIDAAIASGSTDSLPNDAVGHGTHVASLAAGGGGPSGIYRGVAPDASFIIARAANASSEISDASVLTATDVVFWLAEQDGKARGEDRVPTVVNISLGSDFGPHDGTTPLERALAGYVGPEHPGAAIVVAAGNSAGLYDGVSTFPHPLGTHTEVHVPERSRVRVPIVTFPPSRTGPELNAVVYAWIAFRPGDEVSVGLDKRSGSWISPLKRKSAESFRSGKLTATIVNEALSELGQDFTDAPGAAAVILEGTWSRDETFAITLEGHGTAELWVQGGGDLGEEAGGLGALFPAATKESTISIPAAHPSLIAVGATLNRTEWVDRDGETIRIDRFGSIEHPPLDSVAFFSSAGPTSDLRFKPDLLAPGAFVAGAMSRDADPADDPFSVFTGGAFCESRDCAVVDDEHAVTLGTSMASPIVAGAVALLFEGDPTLTSDKVLARLQAGARYPTGRVPLAAQLGAGALDLEGALDVERVEAAPQGRLPSPGKSWLALGRTHASPDPDASVPAFLQLRDAEGKIADGATLSELHVDVRRGGVTGSPELVAPGLVRFAVTADPGTGGETLEVEVRHRDVVLASESLPIAVDVNAAQTGFSARGGCAVARGPGEHRGLVLASVIAAFMARRGTPGNRAARRVRSRGRTGRTARGRPGSSRR